MKDPDWLLDSVPREVQMEALRRSYGGFSLRQGKDDEANPVRLHDGPRVGWGHYLEMRLGKTPTSLNEYELLRRDHGVVNILAIAPNTFKQGWVDEAEKSGSSVPWAVYNSSDLHGVREVSKEPGGYGVAINYEALKTEKSRRFMARMFSRPTMLIIDESIKIKGHNSLQTKEVLAIAKEAAFVRNLSGLPMTQGPQDLYPQFRAIREFNGMNFFAFRARYCKMGGFKGKKVVGIKNEEDLNQKLNKTSFIAKRRDWANELDSNRYIESIPMTPKQKKYYAEIDRDFVTLLETGEEITVDVVVSKLQKLQQISSGFVYHEGKSIFFEDPQKIPKMQRILDLMEETDKKVIVCYHYSASGDALIEALKKYNPATIRGSIWMKKNNVNVDSEKKRFNEDRNCRVMLLQITAGKYGHDLSGVEGDRCEVMAFYENTYSLDDRTQVEMRNTTAFQDWSNLYLDYVCSKVEQNAIKALAEKQSVADAVLDYYRNKEE